MLRALQALLVAAAVVTSSPAYEYSLDHKLVNNNTDLLVNWHVAFTGFDSFSVGGHVLNSLLALNLELVDSKLGELIRVDPLVISEYNNKAEYQVATDTLTVHGLSFRHF